MKTDLVSVVMPAYNAEAYIAEALISVLEQEYAPLEIIVVDDGSTDRTYERAIGLDPRVTVLQQPHRGIFPAINHGIRAARGRWLTFNDADDLWTPDSLAVRLTALRSDETCDMVFGHVQNFYSPETTREFREQLICPSEPQAGIGYHTLLMERAEFIKVGLFEETWLLGGMIEWLSRPATQKLTQTIVSETVLRRRLHPNNTGLRESDARQDYARVLKTILLRKRAA